MVIWFMIKTVLLVIVERKNFRIIYIEIINYLYVKKGNDFYFII